MFGEHQSESPRVPSPWDPFLPSPPHAASPPPFDLALHSGIPKLVPEVEEGNVEYKLKLTHVSNARFARLVTQLKWRLLEGGGQAYYELGVADSGALIGLSRTDLEESLETLEMMAGEIGASVIIVKEIEVPLAISSLADKESGYTDPDTGEWTRKMRRRAVLSLDGDCSTSAPTTEAETDFSPSPTDVDDISSPASGLQTPARAYPFPVYAAASHSQQLQSNPNRPAAQSSPFIAPLDDDLALFSMEPEPEHHEDEWSTSYPGPGTALPPLDLDSCRTSYAGIEISAVFKLRPVRKRADAPPAGVTPGRHGKRGNKPKEKKAQPWHRTSANIAMPVDKEAQAAQRRQARDKRREEKRNALAAASSTGQFTGAAVTSTADIHSESPPKDATADVGNVTAVVEGETDELVHALDELRVSVDGVDTDRDSPVLAMQRLAEEVKVIAETEKGREPRLIVEALVVRKMSIEEATLDFGGFALI